ncbi:MAG: hypothetical protein PVI30_27230 [Myxococcales bacterium]
MLGGRCRRWGLALVVWAGALATACGDDVCEGTEGCQCFGNDTCLDGLSCASGLCVDLAAADDGGMDASTSGDAAGPRGEDGGEPADGGDRGDGDGDGAGDGDGDEGGGTVEQGGECESSAECASLDDPCLQPVCVSGACDSATRPAGSPVDDQTAGDCQRVVCAEGGSLESEPDGSDLPPEDGDPCTVSACDGPDPTQIPASMGTRAPDSAQTSGDCQTIVCDGEGGLTVMYDDADVVTDPTGDPCTRNVCNAGTPGEGNVTAGTPCGTDMVCDGAGGCVACKPDGDGCTASAECCGGLCYNGATCTSCPQNMGDCDADVGNGCEVSITNSLNCGACGNDCTGRPFVATASCSSGTCGVSRCESGRLDVDGVFDNGCEAMATFGPNGPYAPCTAANAATTCGFGEACGVVDAANILTTFRECTAEDDNCFCAWPCLNGVDCPAPPSGSGTTTNCAEGYCFIRCHQEGAVCPDDLQCEDIGSLISTAKACLGSP